MTANKKVNIAAIKPNEENPRYITDAKFKKLIKSIKEFPEMLETRPLVVDENMVVLGGNMRLKALKSAGVFEVPVHQVKGWTEEKKKEFIIKDNLGYGEWDYDALGNYWQSEQLIEWGLNVWNPEEDYFEVDDEQDEQKPTASSDDHSTFEIVMEYDNKKKLLKVLSDIKQKHNLEKQEDAIMLLINKYIENEGK